MGRTLPITALVLAGVLAVLPLLSAHAAAPLRTQSGALVHWEAETITVGLGKKPSASLPPASVLLAITEASRAWNTLPGKKPRFVPSSLDTGPEHLDVKVEFCTGAWRFAAGLLATTEFKAQVSNGQVSEATILVNECDYKFVGPEEVADGHFDLQAVLTHELGHVFGLGHSTDPTAVMFENTGSVRQRRPTADDRMGLALIYDPQVTSAAESPKPTVSTGTRPAAHEITPGSTAGTTPKGIELGWDDVEVVTSAKRPGTTNPTATSSKPPALIPAPNNAPAQRSEAPSRDSPSRPSEKPPRQAPPADMIHAVKLDTNSDLMLYTIDPVILPAFEPIKATKQKKGITSTKPKFRTRR